MGPDATPLLVGSVGGVGMVAGTRTGAPATWGGAAWGQGDYITFAPLPSATGALRLSYSAAAQVHIAIRNSLDTADYHILRTLGDTLQLGGSTGATYTAIYGYSVALNSGAGGTIFCDSTGANAGVRVAIDGTGTIPASGVLRFAHKAGSQNLIRGMATSTVEGNIFSVNGTSGWCYLGDAANLNIGVTGYYISLESTASITQYVGATVTSYTEGTHYAFGVPVLGYLSPLRTGVGVQDMANANQTPASSVYRNGTIRLTGAAYTANRTLTIPTATDATAYKMTVEDAVTAHGFDTIISTGAGTTVNLRNDKLINILIDSRGVRATSLTT